MPLHISITVLDKTTPGKMGSYVVLLTYTADLRTVSVQNYFVKNNYPAKINKLLLGLLAMLKNQNLNITRK